MFKKLRLYLLLPLLPLLGCAEHTVHFYPGDPLPLSRLSRIEVEQEHPWVSDPTTVITAIDHQSIGEGAANVREFFLIPGKHSIELRYIDTSTEAPRAFDKQLTTVTYSGLDYIIRSQPSTTSQQPLEFWVEERKRQQ